MRTSEKLDQITAALLKFQNEIEPPVKNSTAKVPTKGGGSYEYDYADLCYLLAHCKKGLEKNGLVFTSVGLTSRILHTSGQWIEGDFPVEVHGLSAQQVGSAMTYGRRYSFQGLLGINAEEDDDGASAEKPAQKAAAKPANAGVPGFRKLGPNESNLHPKTESEEDRVPANVTDAQVPAEEGSEPVEVVTLKALTKEKPDKNGQPHRGLLFTFPDGSEEWWNCYHRPSMDAASKLKDRKVYAKLEDKGGFKVCHEMTEVAG